MIKGFIILVMIAILAALGSSLVFLVRDNSNSDSKRTLKGLTWRIGLSLALFLFLFVAFALGWIQPHAINP